MRVPKDGRPGPCCFVAMQKKFPHLAPHTAPTRLAEQSFWRRQSQLAPPFAYRGVYRYTSNGTGENRYAGIGVFIVASAWPELCKLLEWYNGMHR